MENQIPKCNFKEHKEINASVHCQECNINMCNKCSIYHKGLIENHHLLNFNKNNANIFTGFCEEINHPNKLNYFCKSHNKLCCANCIAKIVEKGDGQHKDCNVCTIENISEEKKNKLKENIIYLEDLSKSFEKSIEEIKDLFKKINNNKEELKLQIQKIFTKIRTKLNEREDELLKNIDEQFTKVYCDENIIKQNETLPKKIKTSLEKGKILVKDWDKSNDIISQINDCINIEKNIKDILLINENLKKLKNGEDIIFKFTPEEKGVNEFLEKISMFGGINYQNKGKYFLLRESPIDLNNNKKYIITGENKNIITKIEKDEWIGILCDDELIKPYIYKWKIKVLKNQCRNIRVGIVPKDYDINSSSYCCGWCFYDYNCLLYSGPPHNYSGKETNLSHIKNEIEIVVNTEKGTMKFIIDNVDKGDSYSDIPFDKPLIPVIFLYRVNDSIEITKE